MIDAPEPKRARTTCEWPEGTVALFMTVSCGRCAATDSFTTTSATHGSGRLKARGWSLSFDGKPLCYDCVTELIKQRHQKVKGERIAALKARARQAAADSARQND